MKSHVSLLIEMEFFFDVDDIIFAFRMKKIDEIEKYINRLKKMFEIKNINQLIYFFEVKIIKNNDVNIISLMQNAYLDKLTKKYNISIDENVFTSLLYN